MRNFPLFKQRRRWSKTTFLLAAVSVVLAQLKAAEAQSSRNGPSSDQRGRIATGTQNKSWEYLRLKRDSLGQPLALQTSITRFKSRNSDKIIDLVGAVHIGEREYYEQLNKQFELYDVVLYELVAPEGTRIPRNQGSKRATNPIGMLQQSAQKMLGLESQLALVDYQKKNFRHADMSPEQIAEKMKERGETPLSLGLSALSEVMKNQDKMTKQLKSSETMSAFANESIFDLLSKPLKLKQVLAAQFTVEGVMEAGMGKTLNRMLIDDRNKTAMKVLHKALKGNQEHIAIFYGAAHMPDFQKRIAAELDMYPVKQVWMDAWDLTKAPQTGTSPMGLMLDMLRQFE